MGKNCYKHFDHVAIVQSYYTLVMITDSIFYLHNRSNSPVELRFVHKFFQLHSIAWCEQLLGARGEVMEEDFVVLRLTEASS